jgi:hypothetical protein
MTFNTSAGTITIDSRPNVLTIRFQNTENVLCVYAEGDRFKVAYIDPYDSDRYPEQVNDIRFEVRT